MLCACATIRVYRFTISACTNIYINISVFGSRIKHSFLEKGLGGIKFTFSVFLDDSNYFLVHEQLLLTLTSVIAISTTLPTTIKASKVFHASVK